MKRLLLVLTVLFFYLNSNAQCIVSSGNACLSSAGSTTLTFYSPDPNCGNTDMSQWSLESPEGADHTPPQIQLDTYFNFTAFTEGVYIISDGQSNVFEFEVYPYPDFTYNVESQYLLCG